MKSFQRFLVVSAVLAVGACSFEVTNPGPVPDPVLNDPGAYNAIVLGVRYNLSRAVSIDAYYSAVAAKEYSTAGRVIATKLPAVSGQLTVDDMSANTYNWTQGARWQAEDGVRRLRTVLEGVPCSVTGPGTCFTANKFAAQLLMFAALANRVLGETFCEAVIDGGARQPSSVYLTRAETQATEAIAIAAAAGDTPTLRAAFAIRASVRLHLGNFAGAGADASTTNVPDAFAPLTAPFDEGTQNILVQSNDAAVGGSFRATTTWRTYFESYFRTSGDLRVRWDSAVASPNVTGKAISGEIANTPWFYQRKYVPSGTTVDRGQPINLVSAREARLIEAEVALRGGNIPLAVSIINTVRTTSTKGVRAGSPALTGYVAVTANEAWMALFHERRIELWLEGRSMGDLRRWIADGTYGNPAGITPDPASEDVANRVRLCFPIARGEWQTNANLVGIAGDDPKSPIYNNILAPW